MFVKENGNAMIVATVLLFPLLAVLIYVGVMYSQMADVSNITEEAARAGARYYAAHGGDEVTAVRKAQEVMQGSANITPVKDIHQQDGNLTGKLEKDNGKFYINGVCLKATGQIKNELESLVGQVVTVNGAMKNYVVFKAGAACEDPIPLQARSGFKWHNSSYFSHYSVGSIPEVMAKEEEISASGQIENIGKITWRKNIVGASYHWYKGEELLIWDGIRSYLSTDILYEETYQWNKQSNPIRIKAPQQSGRLTLKMDMVEEGVTWFSEQAPNPNSKYLVISVYVPGQNEENIKGAIFLDGDELWLNDAAVINPQDETALSEINSLIGKEANLWGNTGGSKPYFLVDSVQENGEGLTFNEQTDVSVGKEGDYAYCIVTYHYPTPVRGLLRLVGGDDLAENIDVKGKAFFKLEGD
jgi:hypothetical protein